MCRPTQTVLITENARSKVRILAEADELTPSESADNAPAAGRRELHHATVATISVQDRHIRVNKAIDSFQRQLDPQPPQGRYVAEVASTRYRSNPYPT